MPGNFTTHSSSDQWNVNVHSNLQFGLPYVGFGTPPSFNFASQITAALTFRFSPQKLSLTLLMLTSQNEWYIQTVCFVLPYHMILFYQIFEDFFFTRVVQFCCCFPSPGAVHQVTDFMKSPPDFTEAFWGPFACIYPKAEYTHEPHLFPLCHFLCLFNMLKPSLTFKFKQACHWHPQISHWDHCFPWHMAASPLPLLIPSHSEVLQEAKDMRPWCFRAVFEFSVQKEEHSFSTSRSARIWQTQGEFHTKPSLLFLSRKQWPRPNVRGSDTRLWATLLPLIGNQLSTATDFTVYLYILSKGQDDSGQSLLQILEAEESQDLSLH